VGALDFFSCIVGVVLFIWSVTTRLCFSQERLLVATQAINIMILIVKDCLSTRPIIIIIIIKLCVGNN
jgi:hypothetical protein